LASFFIATWLLRWRCIGTCGVLTRQG
jgi:hypothetical protein